MAILEYIIYVLNTLQEQISKLAAADPISLTECSISKSKMGDCLEVILHNTTITKQTRKFNIQPNPLSTDVVKEIDLAKLEDQPAFQAVTIRAKVIDIGDTNILADGRGVRNILVADHTESAELALWETFINACEANQSYKFTHLKVKIYRPILPLHTQTEHKNREDHRLGECRTTAVQLHQTYDRN